MGKIMNATALTFSVIVVLFYGLLAFSETTVDLANANMTIRANASYMFIPNLIIPALSVIPWIVWLLVIGLLVVVFAVVWRSW